ncbi:hypothetical protein DFS33DRAFT_1368468 [Desarmillaria ectypa]|nr:hypothetical protein DFS33DRAFT_1368468 [Desarmillaria ectypa]
MAPFSPSVSRTFSLLLLVHSPWGLYLTFHLTEETILPILTIEDPYSPMPPWEQKKKKHDRSIRTKPPGLLFRVPTRLLFPRHMWSKITCDPAYASAGPGIMNTFHHVRIISPE